LSLVWSDEFDVDGTPDGAKWVFEEGFLRNNESQYYTSRPENARVEDGCLILEARKESFKNKAFVPGSADWKTKREFAEYTSASIMSLGKAEWLYGRIEVKAKLPQGSGVWPAIWTLGVNRAAAGWPACGESDIMEHMGREPGKIVATVHYQKDGKHQSFGRGIWPGDLFDGFHVYAVEWTPDSLSYFYDNIKYMVFPLKGAGENGENPFQKPHYLKINFALGGSWGGPIDDSILPRRFLIDYVRVYKREDAH
jgi:beta-glucanase (GH16 family)